MNLLSLANYLSNQWYCLAHCIVLSSFFKDILSPYIASHSNIYLRFLHGSIVHICGYSIGATIKVTRTKSRGRVEVGEGGGIGWSGVEGWGENADNCN